MASLATKVKLYCEANSKTVDFTKDVLLQNDSDGKGDYIKEWNVSGLDNQQMNNLLHKKQQAILKKQTTQSGLHVERPMGISAISSMRCINLSMIGRLELKLLKTQTPSHKEL